MSWSKDRQLVLLAVTGSLMLQTALTPAFSKSPDQPAAKPADSKLSSTASEAPGKATEGPALQIGAEQTPEPESWESLTERAHEQKSEGKNRGAKKLFEQSYEMAKAFASDDVRRPQSAENLAEVFEQEARYNDAQALYQEAFDLHETAYGKGSERLSKSYYNIGRVQMLAGDHTNARRTLKKALDLRQFSSSEEANQEDLPLVYILYNLGVLETETGDFHKAEDHLNRAQSIAQHLAKHTENAKIFSQLALLSLAEGEFQKAEHQADTSLSMAEKFAKGDVRLKAQALDSVAIAQLARRKFKEAASTSEQSLELKRADLGQHPQIANSLLTAGLINIADKRYADAEQCFNEAITIYNRSIEHNQLNCSRALMGRAISNLKQKNKSAAAHDLEEALRLLTSATAEGSHLPAKYTRLYNEQNGPNLNILEMFKQTKSPNTVANQEFDIFGQLLSIALDDGKSDEVFAGMKFTDLLVIMGAGFVVIVLIAMAVLIPGAFSKLFPWGRDDDHATVRNRNRSKQASGKSNVSNQQPGPKQSQQQPQLRSATETERKQVQVWKNRVKTMEKDLPNSPVKSSGAYDRIDFKPPSSEPTISIRQSLSTPVQPEGSNDQYW